MAHRHIPFAEIPWQSPYRGARQKRAVAGRTAMRLLELDDRCPAETCLIGHAGYVLEGALEIEFADGVLRCEAGDGFTIDAGEGDAHVPRVPAGVKTVLLLVEDAGDG